jgi:muramoyltetrapeptide carboxypeptidase
MLTMGTNMPLPENKNAILPHPLQKGDTIGLITPASHTSLEMEEKGIRQITSLGFKVKRGVRLNEKYGYLGGTDQQRLDDIHDFLRDDEVTALWCLRGGYGSGRLLPYLNYDLIRSVRKPIIGYSDITALHNGINNHTGLTGYHAPVGTSDFTEYTLKHLTPLLFNPGDVHSIEPSETTDAEAPVVINEGKAEGRLLGGNLTVFAALCGTPYIPDLKGAILFFEDVGEEPYRLDRMLNQLHQTSDFNQLNGVILGHFTDSDPKDPSKSFTVQEVMQQAFAGLNIPIIYRYSFGHISHQCSLPVGATARVDTSDLSLKIFV